MQPSTWPSTVPTRRPSMYPLSLPTCRPSEQPSFQPSSQPTMQPMTQPTLQPSIAPTLRQKTDSARPSVTPTVRPSIGSAEAVDSATEDVWRLLVTNGTASSGTVTSVTADGLKLALAVVRPSNATLNGTTASFAVALPDSGTTVSLALPTSLSGGAAAIVVTTVEVDASRFSSFESAGSNGSSNSSVTRPTVVLPSPQLVSSVVTIQVSQLHSNGSLTATTVPYFETSVAVVRSNSSSSGAGGSSKPTVLAHNCTVGVVEMVSVYCAGTAVRLNLTCSGRAAVTVRRQCPVSRAVCTVVDLTDNRIVSNSFCRTVDLGSSVVCQCGGSGVNGSALASVGRVSVGVFQVYGAGTLTSVALASALSASDVASRSALMLASFGCFWGVGVLLLVVSWRHWTGERHHSEALPSAQTDAVSTLWARLVLPEFFEGSALLNGHDGRWWASWVKRRWVKVLVASHPYLRTFRTLGCWLRGGGSDRTHLADDGRVVMLDVVQALTALTLACFALALLYDFQYPEDDGFCATQTTQATCENRKMLLDPLQSQCLWRAPRESLSGPYAIDEAAAVVRQISGGRVIDTVPISQTATDESKPCRFNGSNNSSLAFIVSYVITSTFAGVLGLLLDRCQEVLMAKEATMTLKDRRRVGRFTGEATTTTVDANEQTIVREQLAVREYPEAAVHHQRERRRSSATGGRSQAHHRRRRRRHAVMDLLMVDGDPIAARPATRPGPVTLSTDPEAAIALSCHGSTAVSETATAHAVTQAKMSLTSTDYAVTMLRLAVADEVGRLGGPVERHVYLLGLYRAFPAVVTLRRLLLWQCMVLGVLTVCNGGALYYIVSKAAVRGYAWQVSFLKIALFEWFSEVVLLRGVEIALFDYGLCWLVGDEVEAAVRQLEAVAAGESSSITKGEVVAVDNGALPVSQEMARQWLGLPESRWVLGLLEGRSISQRVVPAAVGSGDSRWWTRLLSRGSLETWEMVVSFGSPLVLAWLVFMYYRFVDHWLTSLSTMGKGLAAMTVVLSLILMAATVICCVWFPRLRADTATATSLHCHDVVNLDEPALERNRDDDRVSVDIDGLSWAWSSSSSSVQSLKDSSTTSWQFSGSHWSESHWSESHYEDVNDGCSIVVDDRIGEYDYDHEVTGYGHGYYADSATIDMDDRSEDFDDRDEAWFDYNATPFER